LRTDKTSFYVKQTMCATNISHANISCNIIITDNFLASGVSHKKSETTPKLQPARDFQDTVQLTFGLAEDINQLLANIILNSEKLMNQRLTLNLETDRIQAIKETAQRAAILAKKWIAIHDQYLMQKVNESEQTENLKQQEAESITVVEAPEIEKADNMYGKGERILVVEDEDIVCEFVTKMLRKKGYTVFTATTAQEAVEIFEKENGNFHLIFTDVILPDKSGFNLVNDLQARKPGFQVLFSSGYSNIEEEWSSTQNEDFRFIEKPYSFTELLKIIKKIITAD